MIQVLGLRDFTDSRSGQTKKREVFYSKGWRFERVQDVFDASLVALLERIPEEERYNLYFTVADCFEESGRKLREQWVIPFDIDHLELPEGKELEAAEAAARAGAEALGVPFEDMAVTFTGNGVQFFVQVEDPILSPQYFDETREHYAILVRRIQAKLLEKGIQGKADPSVWSKGRLMRLPNTENRKPGKPHRMARILNGGLKPHKFDVVVASGLEETEIAPHIPDQVLKNYPQPDTPAICAGCKFLVHCKENQEKVSEPEWYAMISVVSRLENGQNLVHQYSEGHPGYNHYETDTKIEQALAASGPRTCKNIDSLWNGCSSCEYYDKVTSPIMIKGDDYISTKDFGFRERRLDKDGNVKPGKPSYMDLVRTYHQEQPVKIIADSQLVYTYDGKKWNQTPELLIKSWMMDRVRPEPNVAEMAEFVGVLKSFNVVRMEWFNRHSENLTPFQNLVYNRVTKETFPHSPEFGFFHTLAFDFDPRATAPRWASFVKEIADDDEETAALLEEYAGYCISGDDCWPQKALFLVGEGANGKSVFMEILGEIAGKEAHAAVPIQDLGKETSRYRLVGKLFNYSEETSVRALENSEIFKTLVNGGAMQVKQLYVQPYEVDNRAKLIMSSNDLPRSSDMSHGFYRRMLLVNLKRQFNPGSEGYDPFLKEKLRLELPGICNRIMAAYESVRVRRTFSAYEMQERNIWNLRKETDTVAMFLEDHVEIVEDPNCWVTFTELYETFKTQTEINGFRAFNSSRFAQQLFRNKPELADRRDRARVNNKQQRIIRGIKLNKEF